MVQTIQRTVPGSKAEIVMSHAARSEVLGDRGLLTARAQNIHEAIHYDAQVHRALVAARLTGGIKGSIRTHSASVRSVGLAQLAPVVAAPVFNSPHPRSNPSISECSQP